MRFINLLHTAGLCYTIVLADGRWSHQNEAITRAKHCHEEGIEIIVVGFGSADRKFLNQIASSSEQSFFTDLDQLVQTFSTIAQELTESGGESDRGSATSSNRAGVLMAIDKTQTTPMRPEFFCPAGDLIPILYGIKPYLNRYSWKSGVHGVFNRTRWGNSL